MRRLAACLAAVVLAVTAALLALQGVTEDPIEPEPEKRDETPRVAPRYGTASSPGDGVPDEVPGSFVRFRVVDREGRPVVGAHIHQQGAGKAGVERAQGTDADGRALLRMPRSNEPRASFSVNRMGFHREHAIIELAVSPERARERTVILRREPRLRVLGQDGREVANPRVSGIEDPVALPDAGANWLYRRGATIGAPGHVSLCLNSLGGELLSGLQREGGTVDIYLLRVDRAPHARIVVERPTGAADADVHVVVVPREGVEAFSAGLSGGLTALPPAWRRFYGRSDRLSHAIKRAPDQISLEPSPPGHPGVRATKSIRRVVSIYALGDVDVRMYLVDHEPFAQTVSITRSTSPVLEWRPTPERWVRHRLIVEDRYGRSLDGLRAELGLPFVAHLPVARGVNEIPLPRGQSDYGISLSAPGCGHVDARIPHDEIGRQTIVRFETLDVKLRFLDRESGRALRGFKARLMGSEGVRQPDGESVLFENVRPERARVRLTFYDVSPPVTVKVSVDLRDVRPGESLDVEVDR